MNKKKSLNNKNIFKVIGLILAVVIMWFMINDFIKNWQSIKPYLANINIGLFVSSIIIYAIAFLFVGYNWSYILWKMDSKNSKMEYLDIHMTSALARYIPGGIWNIVGKAVMCSKLGVEKSKTTVSMILEYVFQIISSGLFIICFIPVLFRSNFNMLFCVLFIILVIGILIMMPLIIKKGTKILSKIFKDDCSDIDFDRKYIYGVLLRYVLSWLVTGVGLIVLVAAFSKIEAMQSLFLILSYPISWVIGFLSPSPNGMGVREGVLGYFLGLLKGGYSYELILLITLTTRIWTILGEALAFIGFKIVYIIFKAKRGKNERSIKK